VAEVAEAELVVDEEEAGVGGQATSLMDYG